MLKQKLNKILLVSSLLAAISCGGPEEPFPEELVKDSPGANRQSLGASQSGSIQVEATTETNFQLNLLNNLSNDWEIETVYIDSPLAIKPEEKFQTTQSLYELIGSSKQFSFKNSRGEKDQLTIRPIPNKEWTQLSQQLKVDIANWKTSYFRINQKNAENLYHTRQAVFTLAERNIREGTLIKFGIIVTSFSKTKGLECHRIEKSVSEFALDSKACWWFIANDKQQFSW